MLWGDSSTRAAGPWAVRAPWFVLAALTVGSGLLVRAVAAGWAAKYAGVALYAVMMVWLVRCVRPGMAAARACAVALVVCFAVEGLQATGVPARINAVVPLARLALGETFSWWDLAGYAVGVVGAWLGLWAWGRVRGR